MEDGTFTPNSLLDVLSDDAMDQLLFDGFWLETTDESNFLRQSGPPTSNTIDSPFCFPNSEANLGNLNQNKHLSQTDPQMDKFPENEAQEHEPTLPSSASTRFGSFSIEGDEMTRRLWIGPTRNPPPTISVKKRLVQAIEYLKESTRHKNILIQIWVPIKRGGRHVLTTNNQPFSLDPNCLSLAEYRHVSLNYHFAAEENSKELIGLPGRVFLKKLPEWTPDVCFFRMEEYPRVSYAQQFNVRGSLALPVFQRASGACLGVVEILTTIRKVNYRLELEDVCKALEAVDLRSLDVPNPQRIEDPNKSNMGVLAEIQNVLQCVCDAHKLPLAQTWAPCIQQGKGGCRHSDENYSCCVSTVDSACYVLDPHVQPFHEACSEHHLLKGEGIAGSAFMTNQPCFSPDIKAYSKTEYPLSHHARMFGLCAAVAIRLRSNFTGSADYVLEFFLPLDCKDAKDQKYMLNSLSSMMQNICQSLRVIADQELADENKSDKVFTSPKDPPGDASSWLTHMMKGQEKGKGISISVGSQREEPEEEVKMTHQWGNSEVGMPTFPEIIQVQHDSGSEDRGEGGEEELFSIGGQWSSGDRRAGERRKTKAEKTISLQVLRQYFAGSLKDAAKNIGVCPTTLKRICRQYGITRWPSRKIKKVGHSLRKLQLVIDSVQGAEGAIRLSSFYSNFPELGSPSALHSGDHTRQPNMHPEGYHTALISPSSSCSHSSSSSLCCSTGAKQSQFLVNGDVSFAQQSGQVLKRARSNAQLPLSGQEEPKILIRSQSQKNFNEHAFLEALPPLPKSGSEYQPDAGIFRVKASFGEEKIRLSLQPHWGVADLQRELLRRFSVDDAGRIDIKYLDDDSEWVLLTCDADLAECIDIHTTSGIRTIKLSLHQVSHPNLGSSFGSTGPS